MTRSALSLSQMFTARSYRQDRSSARRDLTAEGGEGGPRPNTARAGLGCALSPLAGLWRLAAVGRGSVDRRHLAAHRAQVGRELTPMVNRVEVDEPEELRDGLFGHHLAVVVEVRRPL